jgi:hypothetical protein
LNRWIGLLFAIGSVCFAVGPFPGFVQLIWRPDAFGSVCFLVASWLAWREDPGRIAVLNLVGSVFFGISAVAGYIVPSTGDALDLGASNFTTVLGALCFLAGGLLLVPGGGEPDVARPRPRAA